MKMMGKEVARQEDSEEEDPELAKSHFELVIGKNKLNVNDSQMRRGFKP